MLYKLYHYELETKTGRPIAPDDHYKIFESSRGYDDTGRLAEYYGKRESVLMHVRPYRSDFTGLVGRHSLERDVTVYDEVEDEADTKKVDDDDYPHAAFICMPRLRMIAVSDSTQIKADSAISRLHAILAHRQKLVFAAKAIAEQFDLRRAVKRFRVVEVTFEIFPVNPHTGDLGRALDESRMKDHIRKIIGKAEGKATDPLRIDGGFLTSIQQLQQSGHAKVGFTGLTAEGVEVKVPKPRHTRELGEEEHDEAAFGETADVKIVFKKERLEYPFLQSHVTQVRTIARQFSSLADED